MFITFLPDDCAIVSKIVADFHYVVAAAPVDVVAAADVVGFVVLYLLYLHVP